MGENKYYFSVVMAVYNVEDYLREAVESLVHQTIGFSKIQLIMVDDGSTDGSGKICDAYKKKYPKNIVVVHKKNGGVSSARNAGLEFIQGRYVNFMDSDDKFEHDAFKKVYTFFVKNEEKTDVVAVPMKFFEGQTGEHSQNYKFTLGYDILNLFETPYVLNMNATSSFIRSELAEEIRFDTRLKIAEDAKYMITVLLFKMTLGLVRDTVYWYRKRSSGEASALQTATQKYEWYLPSVNYFSKWALDFAEERYHKVPLFVQNEVMYDLQWKFMKPKLPEDILTLNEQKLYRERLFEILSRIDDDVIITQNNLRIDLKLYLLKIKHRHGPELKYLQHGISVYGQAESCISKSSEIGDIELIFSDTAICKTSEFKTVLDFVHVDKKTDMCAIEGYHVLPLIQNMYFKPVLLVNGKIFACEEVNRIQMTGKCLGYPFNKIIGFKGSFRLSDKKMRVIPALCMDEMIIKRKNISVGSFFPVCNTYKNSYAITGNHILFLKHGTLVFSKRQRLIKLVVQEGRFLAEIWKKNLLGGRKAFIGRLCYYVAKSMKRKKLWIISDRIMKADDNGEALFRYLVKHKPDGVLVVFAISKDSPDYARMKRIGPCVNAMSFQHKMLHLLCEVNISSSADAVTINPFNGHHDALRDILRRQHFIFLQHGIIKEDMSEWLNRYNKDISGFITSAVPERQSVLEGNYGYSENTVWKTGLPRYDRLYHNEEKNVTLMPTWREYLMGRLNTETGLWTLASNFLDSDYYLFYDRLINSERLLAALERYGYMLQFFPHPILQPYTQLFHKDTRVKFLPMHTAYRDVYAKSRLVITDYSSAVFDFAYLHKPVVYCQFDKEEFFKGNHAYTKGYFDYEMNGFGEVVYDLDSTIDLIIEYVLNECKLKEIYKNRIDSFFAFNDKQNCYRVVEKILELPEKR